MAKPMEVETEVEAVETELVEVTPEALREVAEGQNGAGGGPPAP